MTEQVREPVIDIILDETNHQQVLEDYNNGDEYIIKGLDDLEMVGMVEYTKKNGQLESFRLIDGC